MSFVVAAVAAILTLWIAMLLAARMRVLVIFRHLGVLFLSPCMASAAGLVTQGPQRVLVEALVPSQIPITLSVCR